METGEIITAICDLEAENRSLKKQMEGMESRLIDSSDFSSAKLSIEAVAELHNLSAATIRKYVELGYLRKHVESSRGKIYIPADEAIKFDKEFSKKMSRDFGHANNLPR